MKLFLSAGIVLSLAVLYQRSPGQTLDPGKVREMVNKYKEEDRGPYRDIRWFCKDGSTVPAQERCPEPGVQRARYKDEVIKLGEQHHIFLGQILSATDPADFRDQKNRNSRMIQYMLEKYLREADDGWILRKARYYRGAVQVEDEEAWGRAFLLNLLADEDFIKKNFFLLRQAVMEVPHRDASPSSMKIRALSLDISEMYRPFMNLRIKIHGQPEAGDLEQVRIFYDAHREKLPEDATSRMDDLIREMEDYYKPLGAEELLDLIMAVDDSPIKKALTDFAGMLAEEDRPVSLLTTSAELIWQIRLELLKQRRPVARLALMDISLELEEFLFKRQQEWKADDVGSLLDKICHLGMAAGGTGHLELWEWTAIISDLNVPVHGEASLGELLFVQDRARSLVEWGTGMVRAIFEETIRKFSAFEPLAYGYVDDRVRSSLLLPMGTAIGIMGDLLASEAGLTNDILDIRNESHARGLNPGYARGVLIVAEDADDLEVSDKNIYIFRRPPADLKPVAGIATVSEGNPVSHVQLLARNLGIPNAVISDDNLESLQKYNGREVFYAVSDKGTVVLKLSEEMSARERRLFETAVRKEERISVPMDRLVLDSTRVMALRKVNATSSGKVCGPKAANLGQLKQMFPEYVVEGLVIPFGIFRMHMEQIMPGKEVSYWQYLEGIFQQAEKQRKEGISDDVVEAFQVTELSYLREQILKMRLMSGFLDDLEKSFVRVLGEEIGAVPVFVRSDTNMEDLKDFTGAGLNLTLFNVLQRERILSGILEVWASAYTERSFKWRQKFLLNPQEIYPSILIIPSVPVDYSGVLITKGIKNGEKEDLTVAFSRGAGGAVEGQSAESYLFTGRKEILLSPAREPYYTVLPMTGGTRKETAYFDDPILNAKNRQMLKFMAYRIEDGMNALLGSAEDMTFDVELGFLRNKLWLFQVRPFVENKKAKTSEYLESISPVINYSRRVELSKKIPS